MARETDATAASPTAQTAEFIRLAEELQRLAGETVLPQQRQLYLRAAARFASLGAGGFAGSLAEVRKAQSREQRRSRRADPSRKGSNAEEGGRKT